MRTLRLSKNSNFGYAWPRSLPDGKLRFSAVVHTGPIIWAREAVRVAIVAEHRALTEDQELRPWGYKSEMPDGLPTFHKHSEFGWEVHGLLEAWHPNPRSNYPDAN